MIPSKTWLLLFIVAAVNAVTLKTYKGFPASSVSVSDSVTGANAVSKGKFFTHPHLLLNHRKDTSWLMQK